MLQLPIQVHTAINGAEPAFKRPALLELNYGRQRIDYWPLTNHGGHAPKELVQPAGMARAQDIAADNERLAIANTGGANILTYNLRTNVERTYPNPGGQAIDLTIDKNHTIYAANIAQSGQGYSVTKYALGQQPQLLSCQYLANPAGIAVDNEGNIYVNEIGNSFVGVVELPNGGMQQCRELALQLEGGYPAGLAVDPKTDDLLVFNDPDLCAGGYEGLLTIYSKPYRKQSSRRLLLGGVCDGGLRLDAESKSVFVLDQTVSGGVSYVNQFAYPGGQLMGTYNGGDPIGVAPIPNAWP